MAKQFKDLKFTDDFMFCRVMQNNEDVCKGVIESILGFEIGGIVQLEGQKAINITDDGHGVRFDIFMKDDSGKVYNIEMQTSHYEDIALRSRYYQSMLDRSLLSKGSSYRELNDSYIIFILLKDIFKLGYNVYEFNSTCKNNRELLLEDRATRIFVNAEKVEEESSLELKDLILYIQDGEARNSLTARIEECVADAKLDTKMEGEFMTLQEMKEDSFNEGIEIGMAKGIEKGKFGVALRSIPIMVGRGFTLEEACDAIGITVEEYENQKSTASRPD